MQFFRDGFLVQLLADLAHTSSTHFFLMTSLTSHVQALVVYLGVIGGLQDLDIPRVRDESHGRERHGL